MGVDVGFDMVPRLSKGAADRQNWDHFIATVQKHYKDDVKVETKANYIEFNAGEHPVLPFEGHKFLRFSSNTAGSIAVETGVRDYIDTVINIARLHFGPRVHVWSELSGQLGYYDWAEVHKSFKSYQTRDDMETHTNLTHITDPIKELSTPLLEVAIIPGRGRGLIARSNIPLGTRILCEKPLLTVKPMPDDELEEYISTQLKALSKNEQRQFLSLHNNFPRMHPFRGVVKTNGLACGCDSSVGGVYANICLINHSCLPNTHHSWNTDAKHETIYAIRPIECGKEITISYHPGKPSAVRQKSLMKSFGFQCTCKQCSLPAAELQASDRRRILIESLDDQIGDPVTFAGSPNTILESCRTLLHLAEEEYEGYPGAILARLFYDAFQVCIANGDQARARTFAQRAYEARLVCEGEDNPDTKKMKAFARKPTDHHSHGLSSMRWKTTKEMVPKGLDADQFEMWLFRMQK
ncbi:SET domain-containing protein [Hypoxylon trugodes]|uniref:SET domain-containing protein n=1 Tax=Hypoxylon trugodes TaxID=326681 RepID=UPI00219ED27F|nr:SET domain-containing protein [Hypoxylon trugodes]KAI1387324.1 SET domain-containing protein [Hypoxylon trugodes]